MDEALRVAVDPNLTLAAFRLVLHASRESLPGQLLAWIEQAGKLQAFAAALGARRLPPPVTDDVEDTHLDSARAAFHFGFLVSARCRIRRNGKFEGSGCLLGPSLVLTAAHVLTTNPAILEFEDVEVEFQDGLREFVAPKPPVFASVSPHDLSAQAPNGSPHYGNEDDFALLRLTRPAGSRYANVPLPAAIWPGSVGGTIFVWHFPDGADHGIGSGRLEAITDPDARWRHDVVTAPGSSGGACFNNRFDLIGIHQGQWPPQRRLVPLSRFVDRIRACVAEDRAPPFLWSLTGDPSGPPVIGRDDLFEAFTHLVKPRTRWRGLRVRRLRPEGPDTGLGFTFQILRALVARNAGQHRLLSYDWPTPLGPTFDLLDDVEAWARRAKWLDAAAAETGLDGARAGETGRAGAVGARAERLARALHARAEADRVIRWIVFDQPVEALGAAREALEALTAAILPWPSLRVVLIGLETLGTPGSELGLAAAARQPDQGPGSFLTEWFGEFTREQVRATLSRAAEASGRARSGGEIAQALAVTLEGLPARNTFSTAELPRVSAALVDQVRPWFEGGP
ncbi:S1 family peptidase [Methylobacterium nonmethylotrophicum]|uniref:S1 family peptidase n=1 Tax=Methylobacterium nonmethylotrophicum TaxID=1141884 RepID=UPI0014366E39|nr:serine protease [Methylobacterium nonmethylotrophicum]